MRAPAHGNSAPKTGYRARLIVIGLTAAACLAALLFRTPLRSRYWAWQVQAASGLAERAIPLTQLCNAGDAGRWGTETLLDHPDEEMRQFGVVVLQHVRSDWSRRRLLEMLADRCQAVVEMAALGLAIHGDTTIIPRLKRLYGEGDVSTASAACAALERLASPEAVAALSELAGRPAEAACRAAIVDALAAIGTPDCAVALVGLLRDHRRCEVSTRAERLLERLAPLAAEQGLVELGTARPASQPAAEATPRTIAERAAAALGRITGMKPPFASDLSDETRGSAAAVWREWVAAQGEEP